MRIARIALIGIWAALCSSAALADPIQFVINKEKSSLKFVAMQNGAPVSGSFATFDADILFDYDYLDKCKIKATVDTGSVSISNKDAEQYVTTPDWLSVKAFPKASFESTKVEKIPSTWDYYTEGKLTLRDKTVPITMNFQIEDHEELAIVQGFFTINRSDFGVGQGEWAKDDVVKNQVRVEFRIVADKKKSTK